MRLDSPNIVVLSKIYVVLAIGLWSVYARDIPGVGTNAETGALMDYEDNDEAGLIDNGLFSLGTLSGPNEDQSYIYKSRSRRLDSPGYFALRGKKDKPFSAWLDYPLSDIYEIEQERPRRFNGKAFVAFRGKRMGHFSDEYNPLLQRIQLAALRLARDKNEEHYSKKRMQFHAMRGRR